MYFDWFSDNLRPTIVSSKCSMLLLICFVGDVCLSLAVQSIRSLLLKSYVIYVFVLSSHTDCSFHRLLSYMPRFGDCNAIVNHSARILVKFYKLFYCFSSLIALLLWNLSAIFLGFALVCQNSILSNSCDTRFVLELCMVVYFCNIHAL